MKASLLSTLAILVVIASGLTSSGQSELTDKRAEALLQLMQQAYADADSYSDTSTAIYRKLDGSERLHVEFKTWFARPSSFRLDAESRSPASGGASRHEVLWSSGASARSWSTGKPVSSEPKVKLIGSRMFGTYAYHIPTLLDASYGGARRLHELSLPVFAGEETIEGVPCYRVKGTWEHDEYEVWIGKLDNLVRKITARYQDHQLEEIHRDISVNQPIAPDVFRFAPEEEKPAVTAVPSPAKRK